MDPVYVAGYHHDDPALRESFNQLSLKVFRVDFEAWYRAGFWNDRYLCHSFVHNGAVIANVSVNLLKWNVPGSGTNAIQISTVMTDPDYRNRGLSRRLMEIVLETYADTCGLFYLFANPKVLDFYPKFGFETCTVYHLELEDLPPHAVSSGYRKLDMEDAGDAALLQEITRNRYFDRDALTIGQAHEILYWYCTYAYRHLLWVAESSKTIVIAENRDHTLHVYDVISTEKPDYEQVVAQFAEPGCRKAVFHFDVESPDLPLKLVACTDVLNPLFVRGDLNRSRPVVYPDTAHA